MMFGVFFGLMFVYLTGWTIAKSWNPSRDSIAARESKSFVNEEGNRNEPDESSPLLQSKGDKPANSVSNLSSDVKSTASIFGPGHRRISISKWVSILFTFATFYPIMFIACITLPTW